MKTAVVYYSHHHGNTRKVIDAIAERHDLTLINAAETTDADLTGYDLIGFASGIYASRFHRSVLNFAERNLPKGKTVFFLYTSASGRAGAAGSIRKVTDLKDADVRGEYSCQGYNTFGPCKLVGGTAKGHPSREELSAAVEFYENLIR